MFYKIKYILGGKTMEENMLKIWNNGFERNRYIDDSIRNLEILKTLYFYNSANDIIKAKQAIERIELTISALNNEVNSVIQNNDIKIKVKKNN